MSKEQSDGVRYVGIKRRRWAGSITFTHFGIKGSAPCEIRDWGRVAGTASTLRLLANELAMTNVINAFIERC